MESQPLTQPTTDSRNAQQGFTIVEMLVVAPLIILMIAGLIAAIVALTGSALITTTKSELVYKTNAALEQFQRDARTASEFRAVSFAPPNVQSSSGTGYAFYTDYPFPVGGIEYGTYMIFRSYATDKNPLNPDRQLVYTTNPDAGACGTATESSNDPLQIDIVYYTKYDGVGTLGHKYSLWRRILHNPAQTPCPGSEIWQQRSCAPEDMAISPCAVEDEFLMGDIYSGGMARYYADIPDRSHEYAYTPVGCDLPRWGPDCNQAGIDCINDCYHVPSPQVNNPYSTEGVNARTIGFSLQPVVLVGDTHVDYYAYAYGSRINSPAE